VDGSTVVELGSTDVAASYACTDLVDPTPVCTAEVDGVPVADGEALPSDSVGVHTLTVTSIDSSGNQTTASATYTVVDTTAPVVTISTTPAPVYQDWNAGTVTVTVSAEDLSALASVEFSLDGGATWTAYAGPFDISTEGTTIIDAQATDDTGNTGSAASETVRIDLTGPIVTSGVPAEVLLGDVVNVQFACDDGAGSGVASCTSEPAEGLPLDTSVPGTVSFTVTAIDNVGNQTVETFSVTVKYAVCLLYNANKPQPATGAVAIKLQLCDAAGNNLSDPAIELTAEEIIAQSNGLTLYPGPNDTGSANEDFLFRYNDSLEGYIYNLNTTEVTDESGALVALGPGEYLFRFSVSTTGEVLYEAPFKLK
jgi:hypothetical protein